MFVSLESWRVACRMVEQEGKRLQSYLQWYPFSQVSDASWKKLTSEDYFDKYIKDSSFVLCKSMRFITKGYVQKQGSSLRDAYLVSPVMFLYLLAYGIEYNSIFVQPRSRGLSLYAGNLENRQMNYQKSWQSYCDKLKQNSAKYSYCLRTDISDFFGMINVDSLVSKMQQYSNKRYSANDGFFFKALLLYCGNGKYPTIENHPAVSFLATDIYLAEVDKKLKARLENMVSIKSIKSFEFVRYVDDMCLFFNIKEDVDLLSIKQVIVNCYADILREEGLVLNQNKLELKDADEILKSAVSVSGIDFSETMMDGEIRVSEDAVSSFFLKLSEAVKQVNYSHKVLIDAIDDCFSVKNPSVPPMTAFRHCLYKQQDLFQTPKAIRAIRTAMQSGNVLYSYNTDDLVQCILNSRDDALIKRLLNGLFQSSRNGTWSSLDSLAAVTYLIHRGMKHSDLRDRLRNADPGLIKFCENFCRKDFVCDSPSDDEKKILAILSGDEISKAQFVEHLRHEQTRNLFESASYYRSFFDRFSSYVNSRVHREKHKWLYREKDLKNVYRDVQKSDEKIRKMEQFRQNNPLIHASSKALESPTFEADLLSVISSIESIISEYIKNVSIEMIA